jgi:mono/diheme cytochrome c family protein
MSLVRSIAALVGVTGVFALMVPRTAAQDAAPAAEKAAYVGDKVCQKCHFQQHKSWKKTPMANAMKSLQPTAEANDKIRFDRKKAAGLDPEKDYTSDEKCLKCHTTGYGEPSGFPKDPKADEAAGKRAAMLSALVCETCHGPGSLYVKFKEPLVAKAVEEKKELKITWEELAKYGLVKPDETVCARCHNKDAPMQPVEPFKFEEAKAKVHDHPVPKK